MKKQSLHVRKAGRATSARQVACVVLSWNSGAMLSRCIRSLAGSKGITPSIIVVDNGSVDGSPEAILKEFPDLDVVRLGVNTGLVHARNEGVCRALRKGARFVFFLDDDAFVSDDCLVGLLDGAEASHGAGIITPRIMDANDQRIIWFDGGGINRWGDTFHRNMGKEDGSRDVPDARGIARSAFATGCSMLVKREVFEKIGFFDESYFMYCEDSDFSFRAGSAGFEILHLQTALAWHAQSAAIRTNRGRWFRDYYVTRNTLRLARGRLTGLRWAVFCAYFATRRVAAPAVYFSVTGQFNRVRAIGSGIHDFCAGKFGSRYT